MDGRIWGLPGPRTLIGDAVEELKHGRHVCVVLPAAMAADPAVTDPLCGALLEEAGRLASSRRVFADSDQQSLLHILAHAIDPDDPPATIPALLSHYGGAGCTFVVAAADLNAKQQAGLPKFLERLEHESRSIAGEGRLSVVLVCGRTHLPVFRGGETSDVSLASVWWWNRIARWDSAAHISHLSGPMITNRVLADIRAETIVEVARWNLALAEDLAHTWSGDPNELPEHLTTPAGDSNPAVDSREPCGPRPGDDLLACWDGGGVDGWHDQLAPAPTPQRVRRLVWAAQARLLLPWIEQRRETLQQRVVAKLSRRRFNEALIELFTPPLTDAGQVEIGHLQRIIDRRIGTSNPALWSAGRRLRDSRNRLAHLDPLPLAELTELVNACRDLH